MSQLHEFVKLAASSILGVDGPLWYRGSVRCNTILELPVLDAALANLNAHQVVVGHTPTTDRRVHAIRDNRVIMLDTGMLVSHYQGRPAALIIEDNEYQVQYLGPTERAEPLGDGGNRLYPLTTRQLHEALESAEITDVEKRWFDQPWDIELVYQGISVKAIFYPDNKKDTVNHELAAYGLDQLLALDLVPITLERTIGGKRGAIQLVSPGAMSESTRLRKGLDIGGWCPIQPQYDLMSAWDFVIDNTGRSTATFGYDRYHWLLYATGHGEAFSTQTTLSDLPTQSGFALSPVVADALNTLDVQNLEAALGKWLHREERLAILARRDALLTQWDPANAQLQPWLR